MDRFLPSPVRNKLTSDTWGVDAVKPRDVLNGIEHPDRSYWGGNVKKVGDEYHLFVCRWAEDHPKGHMGWPQSHVVRAVAPNSWGPYKAVEVIGPGHNPEVYQTKDGSYALYVMGSYYHAASLRGPWTTRKYTFEPRDRRIIEGLSNLSFAPREDGSVLMVCRGGGIWVSETGLSPWQQISNRRAYPDVAGRFEDPVIWKTNIQYHMIVNDWYGRIAWYLRSKDGIDWKVEPGEAYVPGIDRYEDGTNVDWYKYERLKFQQDQHGRAYMAHFAVIDSSKWDDKPNDIHSSKNITIPLTVGRLITVLNKDAIGQNTKTILLRVTAEPGFDPHKDMDIASLRFGASDEVNFGRGCKVIESKADGKDLILTFDAKGNSFTADNFAGKLLGKTSAGMLLFGYSRLPGVTYGDAILSSEMPRVRLQDGQLKLSLNVRNFGLSDSKATELKVRIHSGKTQQILYLTLPELAPYQATELTTSVKSQLDPSLKYHVKISAPQQKTPLFETEQHKKAPLLRVGVADAGVIGVNFAESLTNPGHASQQIAATAPAGQNNALNWKTAGGNKGTRTSLRDGTSIGVRVKIVEPGMIKTDFGGRSFDFNNDESTTEYQGVVGKLTWEYLVQGRGGYSIPVYLPDRDLPQEFGAGQNVNTLSLRRRQTL